jgi:2,7-dihydroxy-5-methyl-1-naphthoate 7-O-methyltransferase
VTGERRFVLLFDRTIIGRLSPSRGHGGARRARFNITREPEYSLVMERSDKAAEVVDLGALSDLCTPWCVHVAATLRIADHIAAGIDEVRGLAAAAECDAEVLHRVLAHLVSKGVFEEPEPGRFALNEAARGLLDPAQRLGLDLQGIGGRMAYAWGSLLSYVRTGAAAYQEVFGLPFWEDLDAHPEIAESFDSLIGQMGHGVPSPDFQVTGGWEKVRTVVDVGGGTGGLLAEILRQLPHIQGTLVDLPRTVARSSAMFEHAGVADRVTTKGQSFFDPLPRVLNDWPDREATAILKRCTEAARPHGRVVVLKSVGPNGAAGGLFIEMVLLGGKPRTVAEFRELARESGLEVLAAERQSSGYFVVECRPI